MTNRLAFTALWLLPALSALDAGAIDRHRIWHQGREIEVIDRGGWAVFEDDIIVGRIDAALRESQAQGPDGRLASKANTLGTASGRWPRGPGQTLSGAYVVPTAGTTLGRLTLDFNASDNATLTWPGGTITLMRFPVGGGGATSAAENGWWWDASEPGRGFSIEIRGGAIFMAGFMYDATGNPVWYYSQGNVNGSGGYNGVLLQTASGQTLTGTYRAPTTLPAVGNVGLTFGGSRSGTLTLPNGRQLTLTRFDF